jgi:hypothetical protein
VRGLDGATSSGGEERTQSAIPPAAGELEKDVRDPSSSWLMDMLALSRRSLEAWMGRRRTNDDDKSRISAGGVGGREGQASALHHPTLLNREGEGPRPMLAVPGMMSAR